MERVHVFITGILFISAISTPILGFGKFTDNIPKLRKPSEIQPQDILYHCIWRQVCFCRLPQRFEKCYQSLTVETQHWLVDQLNECGTSRKYEYGTLEAWTDVLCELPVNETKPCYDIVNPNLMARLSKASYMGDEESKGFEDARRCIEPTLAFCSVFPDECSS